jgi:threonine dehydrogenase-like Zn-dependent dehydrogenase
MSDLAEAIGVVPRQPGLRALAPRVEPARPGTARCEVVVASCCGTDRALERGLYGAAADGHPDIIIGHEGVVRIVERYGDTPLPDAPCYVPVVREARASAPAASRRAPYLVDDPAHVTERGLDGVDGLLRPEAVIALASLVPIMLRPLVATWLEPASTVCRALRVGLAHWTAVADAVDTLMPRRALVLGAGSCGLLAAARLRALAFEVVVLDRVPADSLRARLATRLGADYHAVTRGPAVRGSFRLVFDACGAPHVARAYERLLGPGGQLVAFGIPDEPASATVDLADETLWRTRGSRGRQGSINADPAAWHEARDLLEWIDRSEPRFFAEATTVVDGLRIADVAAALADPHVVKTAIRIAR